MWRRLAAGGLVTLGTVMGLGVLSNLGQGHALGAVLGALVLAGVAPIAAGGWLLLVERRQRRLAAALEDAGDERKILQLAARRGGNLTVPEVMTASGIEMERAERLLDRLCRRGLAEHRIAEDGSLVYRVQTLLGADEKARAKGVLDA
jgi:hypothetical protein